MMKTLFSIAFFAAIVSVGYAADTAWFNGGINGATKSGGDWTNPLPEGVSSTASDYTLDDVEKFSFTATDAKAASASENLSVSSKIKFKYAYDELPMVEADEKAGVIVYTDGESTNFWVLATNVADSVSTTNVWADTGIEAPADLTSEVSVNIAISNGVNATWAFYTIGTSSFVTNVTTSSSNFQYADYSGCGNIDSLIGQLIALGIVVPGYNDPIPQGPQLNDWLTKNNMTEEQFKAQATVQQANGNTAYVNCALGLKNDEQFVSKAQDTSATKITFGIASTPMAGMTIDYKLMKKAPGAEETKVAEGNTPSFEQDIADGIYEVQADLGNGVIRSAKVGAMQINSTKGTEYIAVPWKAFGGVDGISPTNLVKATCLTTDDRLEVYDAANGDWEGYRWNGSEWEPATGDKHVTILTRGMAVKLTRANASTPTYLVGGAIDGTADTPVQTGKWNLVANPGFGEYTIGTSLGTSNRDKVMVAGDSVFTQYTCRSDGWKKIVPTVSGDVQTNVRSSDDMKVPQGVGFFFVNQSGKSAINW